MKPRVFVTRKLPGPALDELAEAADLEIWPEDDPPEKAAIIERVQQVEGLLCLLTDPIDAEVIGSAPNLKVVSSYAVGFDNIDINAATGRGIPVGYTPGVLTETTADLAFSLLMSAARRIVEGADCTRAGRFRAWSPTLLLGRDVYGATLGILGMGRIGRAMARRARGFDMRVIFSGRGKIGDKTVEGATPVSLDRLFEEADFLSLHAPLTEATRGLVDRARLVQMKQNAVLINTARGPIIDHDALYDALRNGGIGYGALDVTDPEPLPDDHALYALPNCLIVPHLGSGSVATRSKMARMAVQNLLAGLQGAPLPHCANPAVYDR
jgi:glyoxylate reductase